ncbi:polyprenol monophosphomannose synthase [Cellulomonas pakistanensis]|uniref:Dolichol-phosphate mannosyltransferase n=1 Tax=Cellulomonas pakistanensis TaxID=992287 RepID=A0A919PE51_9CELL|nr:polyprenol monophosphomannose synthase [Cellulomonas pakistanensis]GIG36497.1 dolichol-phosphate mannosyltransferase [Cellulomonas pakistanensis]
MARTLVIVPTYNELENLEWIVGRVRAAVPAAHLLVVDDSSPDGTGELADALAVADPAVHVLHRAGKEGLGRAYLAGFAWGQAHGYDLLVEMDADGSHHPEALPGMIALAERHDLVLGSRWVPGGRVENWPLHRTVLSRGGNLYARLALGIDVRDATGGFRVYRSTALARLDLEQVESHGYCFQLDLVWRALQAGLDVVEAPITFTERVRGESKMGGAIVRESLVKVTGWGLTRRLRAARERVVHRRALPSVRAHSHVLRRTVPLDA